MAGRSREALSLIIYRDQNPLLEASTRACRWTLELARNAMVVGAILALAARTGNVWIKVLAEITNLALVWFAIEPLYRYRLRALTNTGFGFWIPIVAGACVAIATFWIAISLGTTFRNLFESIAQSTKP